MTEEPNLLTSSAQGRIITQNAELLAFLRSRTMESDKAIRKLYVTPPISSQDDEKYRFISADVHDFDEDQAYALETSDTARNLYNDGGHQQLPQKNHRYEDHKALYSTSNDQLAVDADYARSQNGRKPAQRSAGKQRALVVKPIKSPYHPEFKEDQINQEQLEAEEEYQRQVQTRIRHSEEALAQQQAVPPLDLGHEDDQSLRGIPADSLDLELYDGAPLNDFAPLDSLEEEDQRKPQPAQQSSYMSADSLEDADREPNPFRINWEEHGMSPSPSKPRGSHRQPPPPPADDPRMQQMFAPSHPEPNPQGYSDQLGAYEVPQPSPRHDIPRQIPFSKSSPDPGTHPPTVRNQPQQYVDPQNAFYQQYLQESQHFNAQFETGVIPPQRSPDPVEVESPKPRVKPNLAPPPVRRNVDFLQKNKEVLAQPSRKTYGRLHTQKKENIAPPAGKPPLPGRSPKVPANQSIPTEVATPQVVSAEQLWHQRAQHLANHQEGKNSGKKKRQGTLRKFPSESKVDDLRQDQKPHFVRPIPQVRQSRAEPIRSEVVADANVLTGRPITHSIVTEDGQRVSVDINLKLVSPPPHKPLGPIPQGSNPVGPASPGQGVVGPSYVQQGPPQFQAQQQVPHGVPQQYQIPQGHQQKHQVPQGHQPQYQIPQGHQPQYQMPQGHQQQHQIPQGHQQQHQMAQGHQPQYQMPQGYQQQYQLPPQQYQQMPPQQYQQVPQGPPQPGPPQQGYGQNPYQYQSPRQAFQEPDMIMAHQLNSNPNQPVFRPALQQQQAAHTDGYQHDFYDPHSTGNVQSPVTSPYRVLPPIGSADTDMSQEPDQSSYPIPNHRDVSPRREEQKGSYMQQYAKQKTKKVDYQKYTLEDYRKLKKEIRLGALGPDLDSENFNEKKEKMQRQNEYARQIAERNRQTYKAALNKQQQQQQSRRQQDFEERYEDTLNRRQVAMEYARSVPKPKVQPKRSSASDVTGNNTYRGRGQQDPGDLSHWQQGSVSAGNSPMVQKLTVRHNVNQAELQELELLEERHAREMAKVEMIRRNMDHTVPQKA